MLGSHDLLGVIGAPVLHDHVVGGLGYFHSWGAGYWTRGVWRIIVDYCGSLYRDLILLSRRFRRGAWGEIPGIVAPNPGNQKVRPRMRPHRRWRSPDCRPLVTRRGDGEAHGCGQSPY